MDSLHKGTAIRIVFLGHASSGSITFFYLSAIVLCNVRAHLFITHVVPRDLLKSCRPFWMTSSGRKNMQIIKRKGTLEEDVSSITVVSVAADGWDAKTPVRTLMAKFGSLMCMGPAVDGLTHWGRVTHKCVGNLTIIVSDNGLSPGRRQAIIRTNAWILLIGPLGTNFREILVRNQTFSFRKMHLKMSSAL